jgi:transketolase
MWHSVDELRLLSARARRQVIDLWRINRAPLSGALSIVDLYVVLYFELLRHAPAREQVRFIPKTTSANAVYAVAGLAGMAGRPMSVDHGGAEHRRQNFPPVPRRGRFGIAASAHKLGTNLGQAVGHALHGKLRRTGHRTVVVISDGELQCGLDHEAKLAASWRLDNLVLVIDLNGLQSSYPVSLVDPTVAADDTGRCRRLERLWDTYGWHYQEVDGHDHQAIYDALTGPAPDGRPQVVVAHAVKGKGIPFIESRLGYEHALADEEVAAAIDALEAEVRRHRGGARGRAPSQAAGGPEPAPARPKRPRLPAGPFPTDTDRHRITLREWLARFRDLNEGRVYLINTDNPIPFDRHAPVFDGGDPHQHVFCGINEPVAMSVARGMANEGALPIYLSPAAHLLSCGEEFLHCGIDRQPVLVIGFYPGVDLAAWGASHASYRDILAFGAPGVTVYQPAGPNDLLMILTGLYSDPDRQLPAYLRMGRRGLPGLPHPPSGTERDRLFQQGFYPMPRSGHEEPGGGGPSDVVIFGSGTILAECLGAAADLRRQGVTATVVNVLNLSRVDPVPLARVVEGAGCCVSCVDADPFALAEPLCRALPKDLRGRFLPMGVTGHASTLDRAAELAAHGIDRRSITERVRTFVARTSGTGAAMEAV